MEVNGKKGSGSDKNKGQTNSSAKSAKKPANNVNAVDYEVYLPYLDNVTIDNLELCHVVFSGKIRINQRNPREAYIPAPDNGSDVLVLGVWERNRSLEGDEVYAIMQTSARRRAVVVGIKVPAHNRVVVGTLTVPKGQNFGMLKPTDPRLPLVRIPLNNLPKERNNKLFAARIAQWTHVKFALSYIIETLGDSGSVAAETKGILLRFSIDPNPYPPHFSKYFPPADFIPSAEELKKRMDCRKMCVFTIDPATAKDLDDAVSCEIRSDGSLRIGVHIADVSYFFSEGTEFDTAVANRATTVYLVDQVFHMLPKDLCLLCSLLPGKDRLTFSVFWELDTNYKIVKTYFHKTVINSCAQLSYQHAQQLIAGDDGDFPEILNGFSVDDIKQVVLALNKVATQLRTARFEEGALAIQQIKIGFVWDETGRFPVDFYQEQRVDAHYLIEEFMLLANISVAKHIEQYCPHIALLRRHLPPKGEYLDRIQALLERFGIVIDPASSKTLQESLNKFSSEVPEEQIRSIVINHLMTKPMIRADYYCSFYVTEPSARSHYGLNVTSYTHFTSPIRRYADIMVHRMLASCLKLREMPLWTPAYVHHVAEQCNEKKYKAKLAGDASIELFFAVFVAEQGSLVVEAVVHNIANGAIEAIIACSGSHVRIPFLNIDGHVKVENDENSNEAVINWARGRQQKICIFSRIMLEISRGKGVTLDATLLPLTAEDNYLMTNST